jgi:sugar fermentation stimulation protein A
VPAGLNSIKYFFPSPLLPGVLIRRYKRFLALVRLEDGQEVTAHCPNSGAMTGCAEEGMRIALSPAPDPGRRTPYTWQLSRGEESWICVNTGLANHLAAAAARAGVGACFRGVIRVKPEIRVNSGASRLDLLAWTPQGPCYVEVKSVTLREGNKACFPDARTSRGARHLRELMALKAQGYRALLLFVVNRQDVTGFAPARHIDPVYADLLARAGAAGVEIVIWQNRVSLQGLSLWRQLRNS